MTATATFYVFLVSGTLLEIAADLLFKRWGQEGRPALLYTGLVLYLCGALLWAWSLRYATLGKAAVVFAVINTILLCLGGWLLFHERLTASHALGVVLGLVAVAMMERAE
ncbi:MAG: EamA family transporter [Magnetospirillum sp.]|nr:EamA family transporter [Magnetospirillum sp.]